MRTSCEEFSFENSKLYLHARFSFRLYFRRRCSVFRYIAFAAIWQPRFSSRAHKLFRFLWNRGICSWEPSGIRCPRWDTTEELQDQRGRHFHGVLQGGVLLGELALLPFCPSAQNGAPLSVREFLPEGPFSSGSPIPNAIRVGSRTGAVFRRSSLSVAPRFLWECLNSRTVNPFPAPAASHPACRFPALGAPVCLVSRVM